MKDEIGQPLREAREARNWSAEDVAEKLRISARYVIAIEEGDVDALPEPTFVRGYVKAYAKLVGMNADALAAALAPVEVKAPRPLIGPDGQAGTSRRVKAGGRAPSFRSSGSHRRHWVLGGLIAVVAGGWMVWPQRDEVESSAPEIISGELVSPSGTSTVAAQPSAAPMASADAALPSVATGGVTLEVPLPGATPAPASAVESSAAATGQVSAGVPAAVATSVATSVATPVAVTGNTPAATLPAAAGTPVAATSSPTASPVAVPRKGLHARFTSTCWVEVRDADNVVIYTRIAMPGSELSLEGKAPLTVTLGDGSAASVWYNGDRIVADRFSSNGISRLIVGQAPR